MQVEDGITWGGSTSHNATDPYMRWVVNDTFQLWPEGVVPVAALICLYLLLGWQGSRAERSSKSPGLIELTQEIVGPQWTRRAGVDRRIPVRDRDVWVKGTQRILKTTKEFAVPRKEV